MNCVQEVGVMMIKLQDVIDLPAPSASQPYKDDRIVYPHSKITF